MTPRFPRTEALIPDDVLAKLVENGRTSEERDGFDPFPVVKLFTPDAGATWLITEAYPEASDVRLFGLCDLGMGCPELGYLMLSEIEDVRGKLGLPVERDLHFKAEHRLSTYTENARRAGSPSSNREADMIALIVVTIMLIGMMCVLAYTLAIYALPFMLALAAARFAYGTGAGWIGAGVVGFVAGAASFGILTFLFAMLRAPILRIALTLIFAAPAAVAGYALVHGVTAEAVPLPVWRQIFCLAGGALVGAAAAMRLAASAASQS